MPKFMIEFKDLKSRSRETRVRGVQRVTVAADGADQAVGKLQTEIGKVNIVRVDRVFTPGVGFSKGSIMNHGDSPKCGMQYGVKSGGRAYCKGCKMVFPPVTTGPFRQGQVVRHTANALKSIYGPGGLGAPINGRVAGLLSEGSSSRPAVIIVEWSDGHVVPILASNIELDPRVPASHNVDKKGYSAGKGKSSGGSGPVVIQRLGKHGGFEVSRLDGATQRTKVVAQYGAAVVLARKESKAAGVPIVDRVQGLAKGSAKGLAHGYGKSACIVCLRAMAGRKDGKPYHAKCERIYKSNPRFYEMSMSRPVGRTAGKKAGHCVGDKACEACLS